MNNRDTEILRKTKQRGIIWLSLGVIGVITIFFTSMNYQLIAAIRPLAFLLLGCPIYVGIRMLTLKELPKNESK
jgi:hypothetical protein